MNTLFELELEEALETIESEETKERFKIENLDSANWAFRKLAALERKEKEITQLADAEKNRIETWEKEEKAQIQSSKDFFNFLLEEYYRKQRELDPKFKLSTPYGKVTSRKQQAKWNYDDEVILESLKDNKLDKFIRIKEEVNKSDLKAEVEVLNNVCVERGQVLGEVKPLENEWGESYFNVETGEIYDPTQGDYEFYKQLIVCSGKIVEGIKVEEREPSISIKVVE